MISVLCPCYNEESSIMILYQRVDSVMKNQNEDFKIIFVDDGSKDNTLKILKSIASNDEHVKVIEFSRNFGREIALTALLDYSEGDAAVIIDADLQQPPEIIHSMIKNGTMALTSFTQKELTEIQIRSYADFLRAYSTGFIILLQSRTLLKVLLNFA